MVPAGSWIRRLDVSSITTRKVLRAQERGKTPGVSVARLPLRATTRPGVLLAANLAAPSVRVKPLAIRCLTKSVGAASYPDIMHDQTYEIRASRRRTRTIAIFRENGRIVVAIPATMPQHQQRVQVPPLVERFLTKELHRRAPRGEVELTERARGLFRRWVAPHAEGTEPAMGVRWVATMGRRWGSCTASTGEIRISDRLVSAPEWLVDQVLLHEVTHLIEPNHGPRFRAITAAHPDAERARGFLEGVAFAEQDATGADADSAYD